MTCECGRLPSLRREWSHEKHLHLSSLSFLLVYPRPQFNEIDASRRRSVRPVPLNQLIESSLSVSNDRQQRKILTESLILAQDER